MTDTERAGSQFYIQGDSVCQSTSLPDEVVERVVGLASGPLNFMNNAGAILKSAQQKLAVESQDGTSELACGETGQCPARTGSGLVVKCGGEEAVDPEITLEVMCSKALLSREQAAEVAVAPAALQIGPGGRRYAGEKRFADGCYRHMGALTERYAELVADEIQAAETAHEPKI